MNSYGFNTRLLNEYKVDIEEDDIDEDDPFCNYDDKPKGGFMCSEFDPNTTCRVSNSSFWKTKKTNSES